MTQSLSLRLINEEQVSLDYWLRLELVPSASDLITIEEAADFIDELYGTSICDESYDIPVCGGTITVGDPPEDPTQEEIPEVAAVTLDIKSCEAYTEFFQVYVKLFRSHQDEPYQLVIDYGTVVETVTVEEPIKVTLDVEKRTSVALEYPVVGNIKLSWAGGSIKHEEGSTALTYSNGVISWEASATGVIVAEFQTIYDLVELEIPRATEEDKNDNPWLLHSFRELDDTAYQTQVLTEALLLAFYHYEVTELTINEPELEQGIDQDGNICANPPPTVVGDESVGQGDPYCFDLESKIGLCQCTGDVAKNSDGGQMLSVQEIERTCDPKLKGKGGRYLNKTYTVEYYVDCNETTGEVSDPEYYKKICCDYPDKDMALPRCEEKMRTNKGGHSLDEETKEYYLGFHEHVVFIPVSPEEAGNCGTITTKQVIKANDCCDKVTDLTWDYEESIAVISPSSSGEVFVNGGKSPFSWEVRGAGFWGNAAMTSKKVSTQNGKLLVFTDEDACGMCNIYVKDGCSNTNGAIRATAGYWEEIDPADVPFRDIEPDTVVSASTVGFCGYGITTMEAVVDQYRVRQAYFTAYSSAGVSGSCDDGDPPSTVGELIATLFQTMGIRNSVNLIDPLKAVSSGLIAPTSDNSGIANPASKDLPWQKGAGFYYVEKYDSGTTCANHVFTMGCKSSSSCINLTDPLAWEWVCP